jgi:hypothetical protein
LLETAEELREPADIELFPRAPELEFTPGVRLEPRLPVFIEGEALWLAVLAPFVPPRTELVAFEPPARPK